MHSMPISETIGLVAGGIGGVIGGMIGEAIGEDMGELPKRLCGAAGTTAGHYLASVGTKAVVSSLMLDPIGVGIGATVTSPATALAHGAYAANRGFE